MAQTIVGIDLGSFSVKVSILERSLRDFELVWFEEQTINQASRLSHEEASASALRVLLEKKQIPLDNVAVNFPAHHLACRVLELPFTNVKKIEQTLDFELENYIPLPLEELLIDYHILSIEENRSTVLTAYVPKVRFVRYLDALQAVGVDPRFVGVDAIDLSHIAQIALVPQEGVYALIDIGHEKTNICVMEGQKLQYVRSITVGGFHFTRVLQKAFKLNFEKAEDLKQDRGRVSLSEEGLDQVSRNLNQVAHELLSFIRQTYLGYRHLYADREWGAIFLCGGGARLNGLSEMISSTLRINVGFLECLDLINHRLPEPDALRDVVPLSLAQTIKVIFSNKAVKINFRRGEFAFQRDIKALGGDIKQLGLWLGLVFVLGLFNFLFSYYILQTRISKFDSQVVKEVSKVLPEAKKGMKGEGSTKKLLTTLNSKIGEVQTELDALDSSRQPKVSGLLLEISQKIPSRDEVTVDIDDFNFTGDHLRLDGRTTSFEEVDKIKNALSTSLYFKGVTTQNVAKGVRDEIKFSLSLDVVMPEEGEKEPVKEPEKEPAKEKSDEKEETA